MKDFYISTDKSSLDIEKIRCLLTECFWSKKIPREYIDRFVKYSLCFGVYQASDKKLVGFGRVISDYTTYAYVCDVVIDPHYRKKGLASALIKEMMCHPDLQGLKTWSLVATEDARRLYEKNGFKPTAQVCAHLEISDLNIYTHPNFINLHETS